LARRPIAITIVEDAGDGGIFISAISGLTRDFRTRRREISKRDPGWKVDSDTADKNIQTAQISYNEVDV
jgi:hypothetical protein